MPLFEVKSSIRPMMATLVAHDGTTSNTHISVAKAKMAIMRCCTTVRLAMPYHSLGMFHSSNVTNSTINACVVFLITRLGWKRCSRRLAW